MILLSGYELTIIVLVSCVIITTLGLLIYYLFIDDNNDNNDSKTNYNPNIQYINEKLLALTIAAGQFDQWYSPPALPVV
jgi:hypothetical protein